jgi:HK97 family phage portal protein
MAGLLSRIFKGFGWSSSPGPLTSPAFPTWEGWIPASWPINFGQIGYDPVTMSTNSVVYSCVMLYARTIAQLPGYHMQLQPDNSWEATNATALARILKQPNDYQTPADFLINMVVALLMDGNGLALALRNNRFEVSELHQLPWRSCRPMISTDGEVFYSVGGNPLLDYRADPAFDNGERFIAPQRDILHFRGPADPRNPLIGESPLVAGGLPIAMNTGGAGHYARFFQNMSRPSGVLQTDLVLTKPQVDELRQRWNEQASGVNLGGTPILTAGLKWQQQGFTAADAQIAEAMKLATADIARLFGVPLALIDDMTGATQSNVEQLVMTWLRQGLGYYIKMIEYSFDKLFGLLMSNNDMTNLDVDQLLRPDFQTRIDGLAKAVQGGIYAPNEARAKENLGKAKDGDEPRVQQQVVPLSAWSKQPPKTPPAPPADGQPPAASSANDNPPADNKPADTAAKQYEEMDEAIALIRREVSHDIA